MNRRRFLTGACIGLAGMITGTGAALPPEMVECRARDIAPMTVSAYLNGEDVSEACVCFYAPREAGVLAQGWVEVLPRFRPVHDWKTEPLRDADLWLGTNGEPMVQRLYGVVKWEWNKR